MKDEFVTVCKECLRASCLQGIFYCEKYKTAGVVRLSKSQLRALKTGEHPSYWKTDLELEITP